MRYLLSIVCLTFCLHLSGAQTFSSYAKTCNDCNSTASANCAPTQGVVLCSCKVGYVGDGLNCTRMVFCDTLKCCPDGFNWDINSKQCVDINECNNHTLNKCSPTETCVNRNGIYLCSANKNPVCGGAKCSNDQDCLKINGDAQCVDPCNYYNTINEANRLYTLDSPGRFETDRYYFGWYRYVGKATSLREGCVGTVKCGSFQPYSLGGKHPEIGDGIVNLPLMSNTATNGCVGGTAMPVRACPAGFYIYKFSGLLRYDTYCTDTLVPRTATTTTTTSTTTPTSTTTVPTTKQTSTSPIEGSGTDNWFPSSRKVTLTTILIPSSTTTTTAPTTNTSPKTLSPPANELLQVMQNLQALVESMTQSVSSTEKQWIANNVATLTKSINELDPDATTAALFNFGSELTTAAHDFLSSSFQ